MPTGELSHPTAFRSGAAVARSNGANPQCGASVKQQLPVAVDRHPLALSRSNRARRSPTEEPGPASRPPASAAQHRRTAPRTRWLASAEPRARRSPDTPTPAQHRPHRRGRAREVARGDVVDALRRRDHGTSIGRRLVALRAAGGSRPSVALMRAPTLDVERQRVEGKDARHRVPGDLRQARITVAHRATARRLVHAPAPMTDALGAQVHRRRDRRRLAHRAVAEVLGLPAQFEAHGGKTNGIADRGEQVNPTPIASRTAMRCERVHGRMSPGAS